jgi:hypothetical protein
MDRIASEVENDPGYAARVHFIETRPDPTTADALAEACASDRQGAAPSRVSSSSPARVRRPAAWPANGRACRCWC